MIQCCFRRETLFMHFPTFPPPPFEHRATIDQCSRSFPAAIDLHQELLMISSRVVYAFIARAICVEHWDHVFSTLRLQSCTERGRRVVQDGMDILGGAGICRGDMNFIGNM